MRRRPAASIVANPVLIGAVTTLVVIVAVFLAYNANSGLPFVPTHDYKVIAPNGLNLVSGNEVRTGGYRIGLVSDLKPVRVRGGKVGAELTLKLDESTGRLPIDSTFVIRPRSVLGLKYLDVHLGTSTHMAPDGYTFPVGQFSTREVDLDQFFNMFDLPTRNGARDALTGFGDALAGRGQSLNETIHELPRLLRHLEPVARNLASDRTQLASFFRSLGRAAGAVAPVARQQALIFTYGATTFGAIAHDPEALKATISKAPSTLAVGTRSLKAQRPFLRHFAGLSRDLRKTAAVLPSTLPPISDAIETGTPVLRSSTKLNTRLEGALGALNNLVSDPETLIALRATSATVATLNPQLRFLGPYVTVCNQWNFFWTLLSEHLSEFDSTGTSQRALLNFAAPQQNSVGAEPAITPANGQGVLPGQTPQYLHAQPYGAAVNDDGTADCEIGQRGYAYQVNEIGDQSYHIAIDPHTPGSQGPNYAKLDKQGHGHGLGPARVPEGETYTREPDTGPQLDPRLLVATGNPPPVQGSPTP